MPDAEKKNLESKNEAGPENGSSAKIMGAIITHPPTPEIPRSESNEELEALKLDMNNIIQLIKKNLTTIQNLGINRNKEYLGSLDRILRQVDQAENITQFEEAFALFRLRHDIDTPFIQKLSEKLNELPQSNEKEEMAHWELSSFLSQFQDNIKSMIGNIRSIKEEAALPGIKEDMKEIIEITRRNAKTIGITLSEEWFNDKINEVNEAKHISQLEGPLELLWQDFGIGSALNKEFSDKLSTRPKNGQEYQALDSSIKELPGKIQSTSDKFTNIELLEFRLDIKKMINMITDSYTVKGKILNDVLTEAEEAKNIPQLEKAFTKFQEHYYVDSDFIKILSNTLSELLEEDEKKHNDLNLYINNLLGKIKSTRDKFSDFRELPGLKVRMKEIIQLVWETENIKTIESGGVVFGEENTELFELILRKVDEAKNIQEFKKAFELFRMYHDKDSNMIKILSKNLQKLSNLPERKAEYEQLDSLINNLLGSIKSMRDKLADTESADENARINEIKAGLAGIVSVIIKFFPLLEQANHFIDKAEIYKLYVTIQLATRIQELVGPLEILKDHIKHIEHISPEDFYNIDRALASTRKDIDEHWQDLLPTPSSVEFNESEIYYVQEKALVKRITGDLKDSYIDKLNEYILDKMQSNPYDSLKNNERYKIALKLRDALIPEMSILNEISSRQGQSPADVEKILAAVQKIDEAFDTATEALKKIHLMERGPTKGGKDVITRSWEGRVKQFVMGGKVSLSELLTKHEKNPREFSADKLREAMKIDRGPR